MNDLSPALTASDGSLDHTGPVPTPPSSLRNVGAGDRFAVSEADAVGFAGLPQDVRDQVSRLLRCMQEISRAVTVQRGCKLQAALFHGERGFTTGSLRRKYDAFVDSGGDWRSLMDRAKAGPAFYQHRDPEAHVKLPPAFIEFWKGLCQQNQRKCKPAERVLLRRWQGWRRGADAIPGYDRCPEPNPATGRPVGWTYRNLMRHKPTRFELMASRQGRSAAAPYRPKVMTTRVGLRVGEFYLFDDLWHDFKVNSIGQRHAQRLLQLHALDLFSGCNFARGLKPVLENEVTGVQERLKESEMVFLVAFVLSNFGFQPETGTTLVVEHGTAAIREDIEQRLTDLTGGLIKVARSGIEGASAFAGQYAGRSKGNFRFKAALESSGNLIHNETADMLEFPGQVGSNSRINAPEELHGRDRENDGLLRAMVALAPERAALLRLPFLEFNQAVRLVTEVHERINHRTEHDLEGWVEAGLVAHEFRLADDQPWMPASRLLGLSDAQRGAVEALLMAEVQSEGALTRIRQLSPAEVFATGKKGLKRLASHQVALLLGPERGREVGIRGNMIEFEDRDLGPSPVRFEPVVQGQRLPDGERFNAVVNPFDAEELHLFDARGRYVGSCPRWRSYCRADADALARAMGRAAKAQAELLAPVAARGAAMTRQRLEAARHNAAVLGGRPVTQEEKATARRETSRLARETDDFTALPGEAPGATGDGTSSGGYAVSMDELNQL